MQLNSPPSWHISSNVYKDPHMFKRTRIEIVPVQLTHMWHVSIHKVILWQYSSLTLTFSVDLNLEL